MYEKLFALKKSPFGMTPDPDCVFMTASHREALAGLFYAVTRSKGFVVLIGDAGTGKTTLLRVLIRQCPTAQFGVILNPILNLEEFLESVLLDFGIEDIPQSKTQRISRLQDFLCHLQDQGKSAILVVDEAHKLSPDLLEEIRLLTNFETAERKLVQIVLAGQSELATILNRSDLRQLKQRIEVRLEVKPLTAPEVEGYMRHRWEKAGATTMLPFTPDAIALISAASGGIPRLVNAICDNALLLAFSDSLRQVGIEQVEEALRDLDMEGRYEPARAEAAPAPSDAGDLHGRPGRNGSNGEGGLPTLNLYATSSPLIFRWASWLKVGRVQRTRTRT
jgi:general secretion pathway protein A